MTPLAYHVLLEGRRMGPYDRRTVIGLRIKKTITSAHELEASDGSRLTVAQLLGRRADAAEFDPQRTGGYGSARLTRSAWLIASERGPVSIPAFRGEIELRVHGDMLRIAGKHRSGFGLKDGRVKLPLANIVHYRASGSRLELWLRGETGQRGSDRLQRITIDLFSEEAVHEVLQWLPGTAQWPQPDKAQGPAADAPVVALSPLIWAAVLGVVMVAGLVLLVVLRRRF